jgi:hypothetical protein
VVWTHYTTGVYVRPGTHTLATWRRTLLARSCVTTGGSPGVVSTMAVALLASCLDSGSMLELEGRSSGSKGTRMAECIASQLGQVTLSRPWRLGCRPQPAGAEGGLHSAAVAR